MARPPSIESFGLERKEGGFSLSFDSFEFLVPFTGPNTDDTVWLFRRIVGPKLTPALQNLQNYTYSSEKKAYVVFEVVLEPAEGIRVTEMRLWQMIVDNWIVSGNPPASLRYVGFASIVNETVVQLIQEEFQRAAPASSSSSSQVRRESHSEVVDDFGTNVQRMLTITPETETGRQRPSWGANPFIRIGVHVAASLSTLQDQTVTCVKAHLIKRNDLDLYMVLEFKTTGGESLPGGGR